MVLEFGSLAGKGGWRSDFPLSTGRQEYRLEMRGMGQCHPMLLVRLRTFLEWQQREGSEIDALLPTDPAVCAHLAEMRVFTDVAASLDQSIGKGIRGMRAVVPMTTVTDAAEIERLAEAAVGALEAVPGRVGRLANPLHMAISELGDNAVSHGRNDLGVRVACDVDPSAHEIRLAIGDLGGFGETHRTNNRGAV